jgi:cytochrome oxidase assembly protein ShyY1
MLWGAIASFALAFAMAILVGLGFWHAARTPEEARVLSPKAKAVPAS